MSVASAQAATLTISPSVITNCEGILGKATLIWSGSPNQVEIRVGTPTGPQMTGLTAGTGFAQTGEWVVDGMEFHLVNGSGQVEASATAHVACGQGLGSPTVGAGSFSYLPLAIGNRWVYRIDSRSITSGYVTWEVTRSVTRGSRDYFVVRVSRPNGESERLLREDAQGRIWEFIGTNGDLVENVLLDPAQTLVHPFETPLAKFPFTVQPVINTTLDRTNQVFARGVGLVKTERTLVTGSSGGFVESMELIDVSIPGGIHLDMPTTTISLSVEQTRLDIGSGNGFNCAVPSYAVMGGNPDPPGTYKPCVQVRVSGSGEAQEVKITLTQATAFASFILGTGVPIGTGVAGGIGGIEPPPPPIFQHSFSPNGMKWVEYIQLPLYSEPNMPLDPGVYRLTVSSREMPVSEVGDGRFSQSIASQLASTILEIK